MKRSAIKRAEVTDGIDATVPFTADDAAALVESMRAHTPRRRIAEMRARIAALGEPLSPTLRPHVDAIRAILDELASLTGTAATWAQLFALQKAERHWEKILTLRDLVPLAQRGKKSFAGTSSGGAAPRDNPERTAQRKAENDAAKKIWKEHPHKSARAVAKEIDPNKFDSIRQRIAPLKPPLE